MDQFVGSSVLEGAAYPGRRTASSILATVTNLYIPTIRKKRKE